MFKSSEWKVIIAQKLASRITRSPLTTTAVVIAKTSILNQKLYDKLFPWSSAWMGNKIRKRKNMSPASVSCEQGNDFSNTKQSIEFRHIYVIFTFKGW